MLPSLNFFHGLVTVLEGLPFMWGSGRVPGSLERTAAKAVLKGKAPYGACRLGLSFLFGFVVFAVFAGSNKNLRIRFRFQRTGIPLVHGRTGTFKIRVIEITSKTTYIDHSKSSFTQTCRKNRYKYQVDGESSFFSLCATSHKGRGSREPGGFKGLDSRLSCMGRGWLCSLFMSRISLTVISELTGIGLSVSFSAKISESWLKE